MNEKPLRALLLEDSEADAELIVARLTRSGLALDALHVDSAADFRRALSEFAPDLILSDHGVPGFSGHEALAVAKERRAMVPFIMVSGVLDPGEVVSSLRLGADDVVSKDALDDLRPAIEHAMELRRGLRTLSDRQVEVLQLIVTGHTTPGIADRLGISVKTVQTHRSALMSRLDIHDVSGLVRYAVKVRLVPPGGD